MQVGDQVSGYVIDETGKDVLVTGAFQFRTDDPEETIQDIVVKTADGKIVYIDEQDVVR